MKEKQNKDFAEIIRAMEDLGFEVREIKRCEMDRQSRIAIVLSGCRKKEEE